jgi:hypothetical protein
MNEAAFVAQITQSTRRPAAQRISARNRHCDLLVAAPITREVTTSKKIRAEAGIVAPPLNVHSWAVWAVGEALRRLALKSTEMSRAGGGFVAPSSEGGTMSARTTRKGPG